MREVLKSTVDRLSERSKALRRQAAEIEREAGQALAIFVRGLRQPWTDVDPARAFRWLS